jgi:hypothetical protein
LFANGPKGREHWHAGVERLVQCLRQQQQTARRQPEGGCRGGFRGRIEFSDLDENAALAVQRFVQ